MMPPKSIIEREPTEYEIMDGGQGYRQIYFSVELNDKEKEDLEQVNAKVKSELQKEGLCYPSCWMKGDSLRYLAQFDHNIDKTVKNIIGHIKFLDNHHKFVLTDEAADQLRNGCITIAGKDKNGVANLVWNIKKQGTIDNDTCKKADLAQDL